MATHLSYVGDHLSHQCRCIIVTEGAKAIVDYDAQRIADIAQTCAGRSLGENPARFWYDKRYAVSYKMSNVFRAGVAVDTMEVACAWHQLLGVYAAVKQAGLACGAQVMAHFSHFYLEGGSIYFTFAMPAAGGESAYDRLWESTLNAAIDHGANVSHHHGIGQLKNSALRRAWGDWGAALNSLRRACDPNAILNPATLAMPSTTTAHTAVAQPEAGPQACCIVVQADETLAAIEARLVCHKQTLGCAATLFASIQVVEGARRGLLWRVNSQLGVIETLIMDVDANLAPVHHAFLPAPRAAQGPDLQATLLQQDVTRLWLRTQKVAICSWHVLVTKSSCIPWAQRLVQHPLAEGLRCEIHWRGGDQVHLLVTADHVHTAHADIIAQLIPDASLRGHTQRRAAARNLDAVRFAATWKEAHTHLGACFKPNTEAIAWADGAGLLGFVDAQMTRDGQQDHLFDDGVTRYPLAPAHWATGLVPPAVRDVCESLAAVGVMPSSEASAPIASLAANDGHRTALFLGCQNTPASVPAMRAAHVLTQQRHGPTRVLNDGALCCGHPLARWGHHDAYVAQVDMPEIVWAIDLLPTHSVATYINKHALHDACFATRWLGKSTLRDTYVPQSKVPRSLVEGESG